MKTTTPRCFLAWIAAVMVLAVGAPRGEGANSDAEVKRIAARVNAVETQLDRAVFYEQKTEDAAAKSTLTEQAWFTEAGDWLKVSEDRVSKAGRELAEMWFDKGNAPVFLLMREETAARDGATRVQETRRYYEEDSAIRELTKDAVFQAGEALETKPIKNVSQAVAGLSEEERKSATKRDEAARIIARLIKAGPPKRDPSAESPGDSARFRLIQDSTSPDGRYAVAIGFAEAPKSWDDFYLLTEEVTERETYWIEDVDLREKLRNYVVDLGTHRIVGETGGDVYGTRTTIGRGSWSHCWSPDSRWLVQIIRDKWTGRATAFAVDPERGVIASADVTELARSRAVAFLTAKKDRTLKRLGRDISVLIHDAEVTNDGRVTLDLLPTQPGSPASFESPSLIERFQLKATGKNVGVNFVDARYDE